MTKPNVVALRPQAIDDLVAHLAAHDQQIAELRRLFERMVVAKPVEQHDRVTVRVVAEAMDLTHEAVRTWARAHDGEFAFYDRDARRWCFLRKPLIAWLSEQYGADRVPVQLRDEDTPD